jgi:hypothetical protein
MKIWHLLIVGSQFLSLNLFAEDRPTHHPNPYVDLYLQRVLESECMYKKAVALENLQKVKLDMAENLLSKKAMSYEEYLERKASYELAIAESVQQQSAIKESEALYKLALTRTAAGQDMPICTH